MNKPFLYLKKMITTSISIITMMTNATATMTTPATAPLES
jgi:hypothetical protein